MSVRIPKLKNFKQSKFLVAAAESLSSLLESFPVSFSCILPLGLDLNF